MNEGKLEDFETEDMEISIEDEGEKVNVRFPFCDQGSNSRRLDKQQTVMMIKWLATWLGKQA